MIVVWDASAVVKLVRREPAHDLAGQLWQADVTSVASTLVIAEVAAALARSHREGWLTPSAYAAVVAAGRGLVDQVDLLAVTERRAQRAADLVDAFRLRGADAVHLATALDVADHGSEVVLATWDRRLHAAAFDAGVSVAPAQL